MSFSDSIATTIDNIIQQYIQKISTKYNIDSTELLSLWQTNPSTPSSSLPPPPPPTPPPTEIDSEKLYKATKPELVAMCRTRGLKTTGNKDTLISQIIGHMKGDVKPTPTKTTPTKTTPTKTSKPTPPPIIKKLMSAQPCLAIRRNQHGNHEHPESGLVFNSKTKKVIGKQMDDGTVADLTTEDINLCNKYKFDFILPENLDANTTLDDEQVDELDEEDIESDDDIEEEELLEDDDIEEEEQDDFEYDVEGAYD